MIKKSARLVMLLWDSSLWNQTFQLSIFFWVDKFNELYIFWGSYLKKIRVRVHSSKWKSRNHGKINFDFKGTNLNHALELTVIDCFWFSCYCTLQMFCLLNSLMNACEQSPKTTSSDFNRWKSVTKIFCFHAISTDICLLF